MKNFLTPLAPSEPLCSKIFPKTLILAFEANSATALSRENETKIVKITHCVLVADGFLENPSSSMHRYFKAALARDITKARERDDDGETNAEALDEEMPMLWNKGPTPSRLNLLVFTCIILPFFSKSKSVCFGFGEPAEFIAVAIP